MPLLCRRDASPFAVLYPLYQINYITPSGGGIFAFEVLIHGVCKDDSTKIRANVKNIQLILGKYIPCFSISDFSFLGSTSCLLSMCGISENEEK